MDFTFGSFFLKQRQKLCPIHSLSRRCLGENQQQHGQGHTHNHPHSATSGTPSHPGYPQKLHKKLKSAYAKQMALRGETGSSDSEDEPRRGDAQDKRRIGPSPDHPSEVIIHRPRAASTSQQEETTTKLRLHSKRRPTRRHSDTPEWSRLTRSCRNQTLLITIVVASQASTRNTHISG